MKKLINKYYFVKKNDNLDKISNKFNIDKNNLIKINYIKNEHIEIGDVLILKYPEQTIYHIVKPKDTIKNICLKYNISEEFLKQKNKINTIFIGQKLNIK